MIIPGVLRGNVGVSLFFHVKSTGRSTNETNHKRQSLHFVFFAYSKAYNTEAHNEVSVGID